jgi:hypothetical protein
MGPRVRVLCSLQCCRYEMFYPGSGSEHFFIPDSGSYIKRGTKHNNYRCLFSCSLCFQMQSFIVKKIIHSGFRIQKKISPDPRGEKAPDPGSGSATLIHSNSMTMLRGCHVQNFIFFLRLDFFIEIFYIIYNTLLRHIIGPKAH